MEVIVLHRTSLGGGNCGRLPLPFLRRERSEQVPLALVPNVGRRTAIGLVTYVPLGPRRAALHQAEARGTLVLGGRSARVSSSLALRDEPLAPGPRFLRRHQLLRCLRNGQSVTRQHELQGHRQLLRIRHRSTRIRRRKFSSSRRHRATTSRRNGSSTSRRNGSSTSRRNGSSMTLVDATEQRVVVHGTPLPTLPLHFDGLC